MKNNKTNISQQMDAIVLYQFLVEYNRFEKCIQETYCEEWDNLGEDIKKRIAYYVGSVKGVNTYIEYDTYSIKQDVYKYEESKLTQKLTINQIIRIERKDHSLKKFNFEVQSKLNKQLSFTSYDCILKLINMRNKLAHTILNIKFSSGDVIEVLSDGVISNVDEPWIGELQLNQMSDFSRNVVSNYIFMREITDFISGKEL